jgi:hypothetical protein
MKVFLFALQPADREIVEQKLDVLGHERVSSAGEAQANVIVFEKSSFHTAAGMLAAILNVVKKPTRTILMQADSDPVCIHGALSITCAPVELDIALKYTGTPE